MRSWPALTLTFPTRETAASRHDTASPVAAPESFLSLQDQVSASLDGVEIVAIQEYSEDLWRVCFRDTAARDQATRALGGLAAAGLRIDEVDVPDEDWARRSQAAIRAIRVGVVVVAPPWDSAASAPTPDTVTIVIEPGMGFGSGHHATTRLCLQALQRVDVRGRAVLDIGTGSGVLAIASALLGASSVLAVDVDPDALDSARTNAGLNGHPAELTFRQADFRADRMPQADVVLANLTGAVLASSVEDVLTLCRPEGVAILSGITADEAPGVVEAFALRATIEWQAEEDGWLGLIVRPREHPMSSRSANRAAVTISRRKFLNTSFAAGAALAILPGRAWGLARQSSDRLVASDRPLRLAFVGIGNRGNDMIKTFAATGLVTVVAFCDVDLDGRHTAESRRLHPAVPCFRDFRALFDKMGAEFDAVVISTPDHSHFPLAVRAMGLGKHVYLEKPLAHTFQEVDLLVAMAAHTGVVTQMGNQGHSGNNYFQFKAWTEAGVIKDVTKIVAFMNSERRWHGWRVDGFPTGEPLPPGLDWDGWHAARPMHPFSARLHPENWRGWFAYGNGAFGDWGPHILDTAHRFLDLGLPHTIEAVIRDDPNEFIFPQASTVRFDFAARRGMPPVEVFWYDGVKNRPPLPAELGPGAALSEQNGKFIYSKTLVFKGGTHGDTLRIIPEDRMREMAASLPKIAGGFSDHATNFIRACQGTEESRSPFAVSGPLTQVFLLGVIAQRLGGRLTFDPVRREFPDDAAANRLLAGPPPRPGWEQYYRI